MTTTASSWSPNQSPPSSTSVSVNIDSVEEQLAEVDRLIALGATRVDWEYPDDADFVVLADPNGTLFCIVDVSR